MNIRNIMHKIIVFKYGSFIYGGSLALAVLFIVAFPRIQRARRMIAAWKDDSFAEKITHGLDILWSVVLIIVTAIVDFLVQVFLATVYFQELPKHIFLTQRIQHMFDHWPKYKKRLARDHKKYIKLIVEKANKVDPSPHFRNVPEELR